MKNIKMMALALLFVVFTVSIAQAQTATNMQFEAATHAATKKGILPVYQDVISEISLGYDNAMLNGDIKLANGAVMHIVDYKIRYDNGLNKWRAGDRVIFSPHAHKGKLILAVKRLVKGRVDDSVEPYVIFDVVKSSRTMLTITEIKEQGKFIKLSDNSVWEFSFYNSLSTEDWSVGERVLVSGPTDKNSYTFINLDVPLQHNIYSATATFVVD